MGWDARSPTDTYNFRQFPLSFPLPASVMKSQLIPNLMPDQWSFSHSLPVDVLP